MKTEALDQLDALRAENRRLCAENRLLRMEADRLRHDKLRLGEHIDRMVAQPGPRERGPQYGLGEVTAGTCVVPRRLSNGKRR